MMITFRGGTNEIVVLEEVGDGSGTVAVTYEDRAAIPPINITVHTNVRVSPDITKWLLVGEQMLQGLREGVKVNGVPRIRNSPNPDAPART